MSEQDPLQHPPGDTPRDTGSTPPPYGATPPPPPYGANQPPYGSAPPPPPYGAAPQPYGPVPLDDAQTRQWAGLAHLGGIVGFLPSLIIWLVYRERSGFVDQEAKKALNFQITAVLAYIAASIVGAMTIDGLLNFAVWIVAVVFSIQGYQAVQRGQAYRYPFSLELIK